MNPLTLEWIQKAEGDHNAAQWLAQAVPPVNDAICFHCQPCIEKNLKAWRQEAGIQFRRTHDLEELLDLIVPAMPAWDVWRLDFLILSTHAVELRYPGRVASSADVQHALQACSLVRNEIRRSLGLSP